MGRNRDAKHLNRRGDANGSRKIGQSIDKKRPSPEEVMCQILQKAPWEPLEPMVTDVRQKGPLELPKWFEADSFARGQQFGLANYASLFAAKLAGLAALFRIDTISEVLYGTNKSSSSMTSLKRYMETLRHVIIWYEEDPSTEGSWALSLLEVRRQHARINAFLSENAGQANNKRPPISQFDLVATQFAFCGAMLLKGKLLGVATPSPEDLCGFLHFWKVIGFLIGIKPEYNLCERDHDPEYSIRLVDLAREKVFSPLLQQPHSATSAILTEALIDGIWCLRPQIEPKSFDVILKEFFVGMDARTTVAEREKLTAYPSFVRQMFYWTTWSLHLPLIGPMLRKYHNGSLRFDLYMINHFPVLAWWKYGLSFRLKTH